MTVNGRLASRATRAASAASVLPDVDASGRRSLIGRRDRRGWPAARRITSRSPPRDRWWQPRWPPPEPIHPVRWPRPPLPGRTPSSIGPTASRVIRRPPPSSSAACATVKFDPSQPVRGQTSRRSRSRRVATPSKARSGAPVRRSAGWTAIAPDHERPRPPVLRAPALPMAAAHWPTSHQERGRRKAGVSHSSHTARMVLGSIASHVPAVRVKPPVKLDRQQDADKCADALHLKQWVWPQVRSARSDSGTASAGSGRTNRTSLLCSSIGRPQIRHRSWLIRPESKAEAERLTSKRCASTSGYATVRLDHHSRKDLVSVVLRFPTPPLGTSRMHTRDPSQASAHACCEEGTRDVTSRSYKWQ